jgi:eukaryotic-like serine/threonine-protein kinase
MSGSVGAFAGSARVPGRLAIGPYQVLSTLGEGGHGVVYRARHGDTGAMVALKMVRVADVALLAGIRREIFALRTVEHPGVARIVDDGVEDGHPWYAMEYLGGDTLADLLEGIFQHRRRSGASVTIDASSPIVEEPLESLADTLPPPPRMGLSLDHGALVETLGILRTLCAPLAFVHGEGLVHRDLKPENVVISEHGAPVLVDFGLALRVAGTDSGRDVIDIAGRALGTPAYMAPEQIRGELVDARADLYALGCMIYECVTGSVPFEGAPGQVLRMHLEQRPPPPSCYVDGLPPALDRLVLRLLEKEPRDRMGFATDVAAALAALGGRARSLAGPPPRPYLYRPRLAGRAAAMAALEASLPGLREPLRVTLVGGPSGVGKTRLAMEVATRASRRGVAVVAGQCTEVGGAPLSPLRALLLAIADVCRTVPGEADRILGERGPILAEHEPSLREISGGVAPAPLPAEAARDRLLDALAECFVRYGQAHATLVVLDDLQWADELTLGLLDRLGARDFGDTELTFLGTYRSEETTPGLAALLGAGHVHGLSLGPLDREAVACMVSDMLALSAPPAALVDFLRRESEGNPFFIAEYLRTAVGEGVLRRAADGRWVAGPAAESIAALRSALPMPEGLRGLVRRHLGLLDDDGRRVAEMAAVLGRELDAEVLGAAVELDDRHCNRAIAALRARHVLEEGEHGQLRFVHDKLREFLLEDVGASALPTLHGAAARAIEAHATDLRPVYPVLAHHHALAGHRDEALRYLELAGEQALASAAWERARELFTQALNLAGDVEEPARRARWERRIGVAAYDAGDLVEAQHRLGRALELLGARNPRWQQSPSLAGVAVSLRAVADQIARATRWRPASGASERHREAALAAERLSQVHYFKSEKNLSFATALECLHHAERVGPSPELARAYATISLAVTYVPAPRLTALYGERAEIIAGEVGDPHAQTWVGFMRGIASMRAARRADAERYLGRALAVALESGDVRSGQEIQMFLAQTHSMAGERETALDLARRTLLWAERTRNAQAELWARGAIAKNLVDLGRAAEALTIYREIRPAAERSDDDSTRMALSYAALAHLAEGELDEAKAIADALLDAARPPSTWHACLGYVAAGETYLALGDAGHDLSDRAARVTAVLRRSGRIFRSFAPHAAIFAGLLHARGGRHKRALRAFLWALDETADLPAERARAHFELARHLPEGAERTRHLGAAALLFDRIGAAAWRARLDAL